MCGMIPAKVVGVPDEAPVCQHCGKNVSTEKKRSAFGYGAIVAGRIVLGVVGALLFFTAEGNDKDADNSSEVKATSDAARPRDVDWSKVPISGTSVAWFASKAAIASGQRPVMGTVYEFALMQVVQKVPQGYLFYPSQLLGGGEDYEFVFLRCNNDLAREALAPPGTMAQFTGTFRYKAADGFVHEIYQFDLLTAEARDQLYKGREKLRPST
jgi:hypothetical protein